MTELTQEQATRKECVRLTIAILQQAVDALRLDFEENNAGGKCPEWEAYEPGPHKEFCAAALHIGKTLQSMAVNMYANPSEAARCMQKALDDAAADPTINPKN